MTKPDDARRKNLRRLLNKEDGVVTVAADDLRWLLEESSRLQQSNDRLRRQNRRLRLRGDGPDNDPADEGEGGHACSYVVVVHWQEAECLERQGKLAAMGYDVFAHWRQDGGGVLTRRLSKDPPLAVVVDLGRLPSHGRGVATWLRGRKTLRGVPIVFVPGDEEKTARVRADFSDATFATWSRMRAALRKAVANPPTAPVVPDPPDYSGTPLPKKLGLKPGGVIAAVRAPEDWQETLGTLPEGAVSRRGLVGERDVVVLFCRALAELRADWPAATKCLANAGGLWVAWPKKASGQISDLSSGVVRAFGLDQGLVDNKVCAIDETWSGLRFARRKGGKG